MKLALTLFALVFCAIQAEGAIDKLLQDGKKLDAFLTCLLADTDKDCTERGKKVRQRLSDEISTNCGNCDAAKKEKVLKFLKYISENRKDQFKAILEKYDPTGEGRKKWKETWEKQGVTF